MRAIVMVLALVLAACVAPIRSDPAAPAARSTGPARAVPVHELAPHAPATTAQLAAGPAVEPQVLAEDPAPARTSMQVAGCNTGCANCSLASYRSFVVGTLARTGKDVFPLPRQPSGGYACAAEVAIGDTVVLTAHSPTEGLVIDAWQPFFADDYCPCAGTSVSVCRVEVTADIAARYRRVYCGANWTRPTASVAR